MAIHGYPGGVVSATAPTVTQASASGIWTLAKQLYYNAQGSWPPPKVDFLVIAGGGGASADHGRYPRAELRRH